MSNRIKYIVISIVACTAVAVCALYVARWELRKPELEVYFFHLNRGRAVFLRTPEGKTILIDGGQTSEIMRELTDVFPFYRRRIDILIMTSAAAKNVGGLVEVVDRFDIGKILEATIMGTSTALDAFHKVVERKGIHVEKVGKGDEFEVDGVDFRILFPDPYFKFNKSSLPEMVIEVEYGPHRFLFLGDVSKTVQKSLIPVVDKVHLVEFAHSAADSRVSAPLIEELNPDFILYTKKDSTQAPSKTKKKFDIDLVDTSRLINLEKKGSVLLTF